MADSDNKLPPTSLEEKKALLSKLMEVCAELSADIDKDGRAGAGALVEAASELSEHDVLIHYDVTLHGQHAEDATRKRIKGQFVLSEALSTSMLPEGWRNFENTFYSLVSRPLMNSYMQIINAAIARADMTEPVKRVGLLEELYTHPKLDDKEIDEPATGPKSKK